MTEMTSRGTEERRPRSARQDLAPFGRLTLGLLRVVTIFVAWLPGWSYEPLASVLGRLAELLSGRDRRVCRENLHRVLGLEPGTPEARKMQRAVFRNGILIALESLRGIYRPETVELEGLEELRRFITEAEEAGRGHLIVCAHLGSWELVARGLAEVGSHPFHVLAKPPPSRGVTAFLEEMRERAGNNVFWTDRRSLLRAMLGALRRNESLGFVMDQKPEQRRGPRVDFFGFPTEFPRGPASLAARMDCPVIAVFGLRVGALRYRLVSERLLAAGHGERDEVELTQRMATVIERAIRLAPDQWMWSYRRWYFHEYESAG